jgi:hypothetical protein
MLHPNHVKKVNACVRKQAKAAGIRLYHFVNVGNHLHLVLRINDRRRFRVFIRAITGLIARQVLGAERGPAKQCKNTGSGAGKGSPFKSSAGESRAEQRQQVSKHKSGQEVLRESAQESAQESQHEVRPGYWVKRPFTRVASWGKDYAGLGKYMLKNQRQVSQWGPEITSRLGSIVPGFDPKISIEPYCNSA